MCDKVNVVRLNHEEISVDLGEFDIDKVINVANYLNFRCVDMPFSIGFYTTRLKRFKHNLDTETWD